MIHVALLFLHYIATELGAIPATQYSVMGGGRFFPMVSREVSLIIILLYHRIDLAAGCKMKFTIIIIMYPNVQC